MEATRTQKAPQNILENERPEIANVCEVVDRGPANVHLDLGGLERHKGLSARSERIEKDDISH
jgi:hypothetical protein